MATCDIGIDLGTTYVKIYMEGKGIVLHQPSVIAYNQKSHQVIAVGEEAFQMLGKTPPYILATYPLKAGVISDYQMNALMIDAFLKQIHSSMVVKPRICISVHSLITNVEKHAVIDAAVDAGARKVYLIEEPIASALGAGLDISKPSGVMMVNIGGGTTDIAVLSMNGVVKNHTIKVGGQNLDQALVKYMAVQHKLLIGEPMAEKIKKSFGSVYLPKPRKKTNVKGRNGVSGLPQMVAISQKEVFRAIEEPVMQICDAIYEVLEQTPPELIGDLSDHGIHLAGGGALLGGLEPFLESKLGVHVQLCECPEECTAMGTVQVFDRLEQFFGGVSDAEMYRS